MSQQFLWHWGLTTDARPTGQEISDVRCTVCKIARPKYRSGCEAGHAMCDRCVKPVVAFTPEYDKEKLIRAIERTSFVKPLCMGCVYEIVNQIPERATKTVCEYCEKMFPVSMVEEHKKTDCVYRDVYCKYRPTGCMWTGSHCMRSVHEELCKVPQKIVRELFTAIEYLTLADEKRSRMRFKFAELMANTNIFTQNLYMVPCHKFIVENDIWCRSEYFKAFDHLWFIRMKFTKTFNYCHDRTEKAIMYILHRHSVCGPDITVNYFLIQRPMNAARMIRDMCQFKFTMENRMSLPGYLHLSEISSYTTNILNKGFALRLVMFVDNLIAPLEMDVDFFRPLRRTILPNNPEINTDVSTSSAGPPSDSTEVIEIGPTVPIAGSFADRYQRETTAEALSFVATNVTDCVHTNMEHNLTSNDACDVPLTIGNTRIATMESQLEHARNCTVNYDSANNRSPMSPMEVMEPNPRVLSILNVIRISRLNRNNGFNPDEVQLPDCSTNTDDDVEMVDSHENVEENNGIQANNVIQDNKIDGNIVENFDNEDKIDNDEENVVDGEDGGEEEEDDEDDEPEEEEEDDDDDQNDKKKKRKDDDDDDDGPDSQEPYEDPDNMSDATDSELGDDFDSGEFYFDDTYDIDNNMDYTENGNAHKNSPNNYGNDGKAISKQFEQILFHGFALFDENPIFVASHVLQALQMVYPIPVINTNSVPKPTSKFPSNSMLQENFDIHEKFADNKFGIADNHHKISADIIDDVENSAVNVIVQ